MNEPSVDELLERWRANPTRATTTDLCVVLAELGETQSAPLSAELVREVGREGEASYPDDSEVLLAVGRMYLAANEVQRALRPLTRAGKIAASARAFRLLGEVLLRLGDAQVAVAMFKRAIQGGENDPDTEGWYASARAYVPIQEAHGDAVVAQSVAAGLAQATAAEQAEAPGPEQVAAPPARERLPSVPRDRPLPRFPSVVDLSTAAAIAASMTEAAGSEDQPLPRFPSSTDLRGALFQHALSEVDRSALEDELTGPTAQQSLAPAVRSAARAALSEPSAARPAASPAKAPPPLIEEETGDDPAADNKKTGVYQRASSAQPQASAKASPPSAASAPSDAATAAAPRAAMKTAPMPGGKPEFGLRGTVRMNASKDGPVIAVDTAPAKAGKDSPALAGNTVPMKAGKDGPAVAGTIAEKPAAIDSRETRPEAPPAKSAAAPASVPAPVSAPEPSSGPSSASSAPPAASSAPPAAVLPVSLVDHSAWDREIAPRPKSIPVVAAEPRRRRGRLAVRIAGGVLLVATIGVAGSVLAGKPPWLAEWLPSRSSQSADPGVQPVNNATTSPTAAAPEATAPEPEPPVTAAAEDPPAPEPDDPAEEDAGAAPSVTSEPSAGDAGAAPPATTGTAARDAGAAASSAPPPIKTTAPTKTAAPPPKAPKAPTPTKVASPPSKPAKPTKPTKAGSKQKDVVWLGDPERNQ